MLGLYWLAKRIANQFSVKAIVILACFGGAGAALDRCWIADASMLDHISNESQCCIDMFWGVGSVLVLSWIVVGSGWLQRGHKDPYVRIPEVLCLIIYVLVHVYNFARISSGLMLG